LRQANAASGIKRLFLHLNQWLIRIHSQENAPPPTYRKRHCLRAVEKLGSSGFEVVLTLSVHIRVVSHCRFKQKPIDWVDDVFESNSPNSITIIGIDHF
jgi:hypothetical protein